MSWGDLERGNPELAAVGRERFASGVAYLATVRKDGSPRVHPVTPILNQGHLLIYMVPTSPKGYDLRREPRYALHCAVENSQGGAGEFAISGRAMQVDDFYRWQLANPEKGEQLKDKYILFELSVDEALSTKYEGNETLRQRWKRSE